MALALSSAWLPHADRLAEAARSARAMGFCAVHAARPPRDAAAAREVLEGLEVALAAVAAEPADGADAIAASVAQAARAASVLRRPLVVLDLGRLAAGPRETVEGAVDRLCRALDEALRAWPGLGLAIRPAGAKGRLLGAREVEWVLDDLAAKPVGLWLDLARALALERAEAGPSPLAWAERHARRVLGLSVPGPSGAAEGDAGGSAHPHDEDLGLDWGTLRDLVPARVPRVLDVGSSVPAPRVVDARRRLEGVLGG